MGVRPVIPPGIGRPTGKLPAGVTDAHRPSPTRAVLEAALCVQRERAVANDYPVRHGGKLYQLLPPALPGLRGGRVTVEERRDGEVRLRFKGRYLIRLRLDSRARSTDSGKAS
jgi:hypothetical protein